MRSEVAGIPSFTQGWGIRSKGDEEITEQLAFTLSEIARVGHLTTVGLFPGHGTMGGVNPPARNPRGRAACLGLGAGALGLLAARQPLVTGVDKDPTLLSPVHTLLVRDVAGLWMVASLALLFCALLAVVARGVVVQIASAITTVGLAVATGQCAAILLNESATRHLFEALGVSSVSQPRIVVLGLALGLAAVAGGASSTWFTFRTAPGWASFSRRYDRSSPQGLPTDEHSLWAALDAGLDPTLDPTADSTVTPTMESKNSETA